MKFQSISNLLTQLCDIFAIFVAVLCLFGILTNFLALVVCLRNGLSQVATFVIKAFISFMNSLQLIAILWFPFDIYLLNLNQQRYIFKIFIFTIFWSSQSSAYLLVKQLINNYCNKKLIFQSF